MQRDNGHSLFRREAIDASFGQAYGRVYAARHWMDWLVAVLAGGTIVGSVLFITFGTVERKVAIAGILLPAGGLLNITSPSHGIVGRSYSAEGRSVRAGDALFEIRSERHTAVGDTNTLLESQLHERLRSLEREKFARFRHLEEKLGSLRLAIQNARHQISTVDVQIGLGKRKEELAATNLKRAVALQNDGFISDAQKQQKFEDVIDAKGRLSELKRSRLQMQASLLALEAERRNAEDANNTLVASIERQISETRQSIIELQSKASMQISAPSDAVVSALIVEPSQTVNSGQLMAVLTPADAELSELQAQLFAPSRTTGFLAVGQAVRLELMAYPHQLYGTQRGRIREISSTPLAPSELPPLLAASATGRSPGAGAQKQEPLYRIKVQLDAQRIKANDRIHNLRAGMSVLGNITHDRRTIWQWLVTPIYARGQS